MTSKHIIIQTIKEIHKKKKRADIDSIAAGTRDVNLGDIKTTLEELCEEGVLKLTTTKSGFDSYRLDGEMLETNIVSEDDDSDIEINNWTLNTPEKFGKLIAARYTQFREI